MKSNAPYCKSYRPNVLIIHLHKKETHVQPSLRLYRLTFGLTKKKKTPYLRSKYDVPGIFLCAPHASSDPGNTQFELLFFFFLVCTPRSSGMCSTTTTHLFLI